MFFYIYANMAFLLMSVARIVLVLNWLTVCSQYAVAYVFIEIIFKYFTLSYLLCNMTLPLLFISSLMGSVRTFQWKRRTVGFYCGITLNNWQILSHIYWQTFTDSSHHDVILLHI